MQTKFRIVMGDQETILKVKPKHIVLSERDGFGKEPSVESTYRMAWIASGTDLDFDEWLDLVDEIDPIFEDEADAVPPTTKGSRGSRSEQA